MTALLIKEHTAQLSREEGLKYQTQFEKNHIHALSCSTTFEMGVDVGELETVFLRNVPPTAANYAQRAGRAGRSKNSAAYALTYAKLSSHDFNYFNEPEKMIVGKVKPPIFKTDNRKVVLRHIYAVVLSYFFKRYPDFFNNNKADAFLDNGGYELLCELIMEPSQLRDGLYEILQKSIPNVSAYDWVNEFIGENGILRAAVEEYKENVEELQKMIDEYYDQRNSKEANRAEGRLAKYRAKELIDFLVRNNILPKYGFPIDTVELDVNTDEHQKRELQLSRDLKMAISEYAPGEKVIANNRMYTSRYIKKSFFNNRMDYYTSYVCQCDCGTWNYSFNDPHNMDKQAQCVACHKPIPHGKWDNAIEPRAGFVAEHRVEEVPMTRPDKIYHSQDSYIGNGKKIDEYLYTVNDREVILKSSENDSIMVTSHTKFYVCKKCGFTYGFHDIIRDENGKKDKEAIDAIAKRAPYVVVKRKHKNLYDHLCTNTYYYPYVLNHIYKTDVVVMDFQEYNANDKTMWSVLYALLNAMSEVLGIDRNDISGCLKGLYNKDAKELRYSIVLYDAVAGGAGHVRRLLDSNILSQVFNAAYIAMNACNCDSSCYNCLRSYSNQRVHQILDRHLAIDFLKDYIGEVSQLSLKQNDRRIENKDLNLIGNGQYVAGEDYEYIFSLLDDDSPVVKQLQQVFEENDLTKPDYNDIEFTVNGGKSYADLIWTQKKVMLFTADNVEGFNLAKDSVYECFILDNNFNFQQFVMMLK